MPRAENINKGIISVERGPDEKYPFLVKFTGTEGQVWALPFMIARAKGMKNIVEMSEKGIIGPWVTDKYGGKFILPASTADVAITFMNSLQSTLEREFLSALPTEDVFVVAPFTLDGVQKASLKAREIAQEIQQGKQ